MIKIDGGMSRFNFLVSDVSIFSVYSLLQMLPIKILHPTQLALSITCRYILQKLRIFNSIKSIIADTPHQNDISATLVQ